MRRRDHGRHQRDGRYPSLAAFYNADTRRLSSRELDVGLWWREEIDGPLHRAAWIEETGELYLVRSGPAAKGGGSVEVLASADSRESLEEVLSGWRERCGSRARWHGCVRGRRGWASGIAIRCVDGRWGSDR
jgi:hypothetical protein